MATTKVIEPKPVSGASTMKLFGTTPKVYTEAEKQANRDASAAQIAALQQTDAYKSAMGSTSTPSSNSSPTTTTLTPMMGKDGNWTNVNSNLVDQYKANGYTTDLNAAIDYNNLPAGSIYRTENQGLVGSAQVRPQALTNTPSDYKQIGGNQQPTNSNTITEQLKQAQIANDTAALDKARNEGLSNLATEQGKIQPAAIADRNKANIGMNNSNQAWNEFLATKGLNRSGSQALGTGLTQAAYLGNVGSINRDATAKEADITKRTTDLNNNYQSDLAAAKSNAEMIALQNQLSQSNSDREFNYRSSQDSISNNIAQQGATKDQQLNDLKIREASQTLTQNEANLIAQANYKDITAEINRRAAINPNDPYIPYLQATRTEKVNTQNAAQSQLQAAANKAQTASQQAAFDNALAMWKANGTATKAVADILGISVGARTADYSLDSIRVAKSGLNGSGSKGLSITTYANQAKKMMEATKVGTKYTELENGLPVSKYRYDYTKADVENYIRNLSIPDSQKAEIANYIGL